MLGNLFHWMAQHLLSQIPQGLDKVIESVVATGKFAEELAVLEVGQTATAPQVQTDEMGRSYKFDIRVTRSA